MEIATVEQAQASGYLTLSEANQARLAAFRKNADIISGVRWLGVLDSHACIACAALDGTIWNLEGQPLAGESLAFQVPPLHEGCRCVLSAIPKTFAEIGLNIPEPTDKGSRVSSLGPVPGDTTSQLYLKNNPSIAAVILGPVRAALFLSGTSKLRDFIDDNACVIPIENL